MEVSDIWFACFQAMSPAAFPTQLAFSPWRAGATTMMPGTVPMVATAMPVSPTQAAVAPSTPKSNAVSQEQMRSQV